MEKVLESSNRQPEEGSEVVKKTGTEAQKSAREGHTAASPLTWEHIFENIQRRARVTVRQEDL